MKNKKKIIPLIISAVIFLAGCITAIIGASMDSGKSDLLIFAAIRGILNKCATA